MNEQEQNEALREAVEPELDSRAWAIAKFRLPLDASLSEIAQLAAKIKREEF